MAEALGLEFKDLGKELKARDELTPEYTGLRPPLELDPRDED